MAAMAALAADPAADTVKCHPQDGNILLYAVGGVVVLSDTTDPYAERWRREQRADCTWDADVCRHNQEFCHGHDEDISALCGAFCITIREGVVTSASIAFGGMAGTPQRAKAVEAALIGQPWTAETVAVAKAAFAEDFTPLSDWRASARYRLTAAANLLERFWLESRDEVASLQRESA